MPGGKTIGSVDARKRSNFDFYYKDVTKDTVIGPKGKIRKNLVLVQKF